MMVQSIRSSLKTKGGAGVEYSYSQAKALLDLIAKKSHQNIIVPTTLFVKAHLQAAKLLFLLSQCEQSIPGIEKQYLVTLALRTLLKLRHLLPSLDQKLTNPNFPVDVGKHALNDLDMLDF